MKENWKKIEAFTDSTLPDGTCLSCMKSVPKEECTCLWRVYKAVNDLKNVDKP